VSHKTHTQSRRTEVQESNELTDATSKSTAVGSSRQDSLHVRWRSNGCCTAAAVFAAAHCDGLRSYRCALLLHISKLLTTPGRRRTETLRRSHGRCEKLPSEHTNFALHGNLSYTDGPGSSRFCWRAFYCCDTENEFICVRQTIPWPPRPFRPGVTKSSTCSRRSPCKPKYVASA